MVFSFAFISNYIYLCRTEHVITLTFSIMTKHPLWSDEYWLLLMQIYLRKPVGVKPLYSRPMVELSLELHIPPQYLYEQMFNLRRIDTPRMERLWEKYGNNPKRLAKGVRMLRQMKGFSNAREFYEGVEIQESFEKDFRPIESCSGIEPVMLIMVLDLYFRLTPITMVSETPEIIELARLMKVKPQTIVEIMDAFQVCDPYLKREPLPDNRFMEPCRRIWQRYGNDSPENLSAMAAQLTAYFR